MKRLIPLAFSLLLFLAACQPMRNLLFEPEPGELIEPTSTTAAAVTMTLSPTPLHRPTMTSTTPSQASTRTETPMVSQNPEGKFLFIDHHQHTAGTCLSGDCPPGPMIDFPTYEWNEQNNQLVTYLLGFDISTELVAIYGDGTSLEGAVGSGAGTRLYGVYNLPYSKGEFTLQSIDPDGTAHFNYKAGEMVLKPGQEWSHEARENIKQGDSEMLQVMTETLKNYGWLSASQVIKP